MGKTAEFAGHARRVDLSTSLKTGSFRPTSGTLCNIGKDKAKSLVFAILENPFFEEFDHAEISYWICFTRVFACI